MTAADQAYWQRAHRRIIGLQPELAAALLRAYQILRDALSDAELSRLVQAGQVDRVVVEILNDALLARAFLPFRQRIRETAQRSFGYAVSDLPKGGKINGVVAVAFDQLSPHAITAIRTLDDRALNALKPEVREVVRAFLENGLREGANPRTIARGIRGVIGLAPNQLEAVENLRRELLTGQFADAAERTLLDKRFNLERLATLPEAERLKRIETIVESYRKSFTAFHAETVARTATLDAYKVGQRLAWQEAMDAGFIGRGTLMKKWVHLDPQPHPRLTHIAMGLLPAVPFDAPYQNGDAYAGESDPWNCHCLDRVFVA